MPACLFCRRDDVPYIPLFAYGATALVAHVDTRGAPCLEGTSQETHSRMLGDDYPRDLLNDDAMWDLRDVEDDAPGVTARPADPVEVFKRSHAVDLEGTGEAVALPDVEPLAQAPRKPRRPRARKETP